MSESSYCAYSNDPYYAVLEDTPKAQCKYCGKHLIFRGFKRNINDIHSSIMWINTPFKCDCAEAVAEREQERKKRKEAEERGKLIEEEERRLQQEAEHQERVYELLRYSGLGPKHLLQGFENFEETEENTRALTTMKSYAENFDRIVENSGKNSCNGLFVFGPVGVGKTHLSAAVAKQLIRQEKFINMVSMLRLLEELKASFNEHSTAITKPVGRIMFANAMKAKLLILDDLGKEKPTAWGLSKLYELINYRYENLLPTIITSNHAPEELLQILIPSDSKNIVLVEAIVDRILETCRVVAINGESYRLKRFSN